jgi:hypothetical protein
MEEVFIDSKGKQHKQTREVTEVLVVFSTAENDIFDESKVKTLIQDTLKTVGLSVDWSFKPSHFGNEWAVDGVAKPLDAASQPERTP